MALIWGAGVGGLGELVRGIVLSGADQKKKM